MQEQHGTFRPETRRTERQLGALPVGVRPGDIIVIGGGDMSAAECDLFEHELKKALGFDAYLIVTASTTLGVTVLRPER